MTDITPILEAAIASRITRSRETFVAVMDSVASGINGARIDWDEGVPENWGRVLLDSRHLAIVFRPHPLIIVRSGVHYCTPEGVIVLVVDDMSAEVFSVDIDTVEKLVGRAVSRNGWDAGKFSIDDLWWATVI
jgi:hypothetical protein